MVCAAPSAPSISKANTNPVPGSVYFYAPNKGAPVFFAFAFAVSGCFHTYQCMQVVSQVISLPNSS